MRLIIILSLAACTLADKLDRTYLPPPGAASSGGSPGSLNIPFGSQEPSSSGYRPAPTSFGVNGVEQNPIAEDSFNQADQTSPDQQGFSAPSAQGLFVQNAGPTASNNFAPEQGFLNPQQPERSQSAAERSAEILRYTNENDGETFNYSFETSNGISAEESGVATNGVRAQGAFSYTGDDGQVYSVTYTADENGYQPRGDHLPTPPPIPDVILRSIERNAAAAAAGTQEGAYQEDQNESGPQQYTDQQYDAPAQQYNNQEQQSARPTGPFQPYGTPASSGFNAPSRNNGGMNPSLVTGSDASGFAPSGLASTNFAPSGSVLSESASNVFAPSAPASSGFASSGSTTSMQFNRPQGPAVRQPISGISQQQDASGYQYNPAPQPQQIGGEFKTSSSAGQEESSAGRPNTPQGNAQASYRRPQNSVPQHSYRTTGPQNSRPDPQNSYKQPVEYNSNNGVDTSRPMHTQRQQPTASKTTMTEYQNDPYRYNQPMSRGQQNTPSGLSGSSGSFGVSQQFAPQQQPSGAFNPRASQSVAQGQDQGQGEGFGAARQPPSFSPEEGYKY